MRDSAPTAAAREVRTLADVMTLVTLGDSDVRMVALIDLTVLQGELRTVGVRLPAGYELTGVSGSSLENERAARRRRRVDDRAIRRLAAISSSISLERPHDGGSFNARHRLRRGARRAARARRGGDRGRRHAGTATPPSASRHASHRRARAQSRAAIAGAAAAALGVPLSARRRRDRRRSRFDVKRFADAGVLAAVADRAVATTLVTSEGRALTEVMLTCRIARSRS